MAGEEITTRLKNFTCTELLQNQDYLLTEEESLFSSGAIDSFIPRPHLSPARIS
jgi:hypothetical protein